MTCLQATNLTVSIHRKLICKDLSFTINTCDKIALLGPNGVGKTTFLRSLIGLQSIQSGSITINNQPIHHLRKKTLARHIGLLFQHKNQLMPQRVWDYCLLSRYPHYRHSSRTEDETIVKDALHAVDLLSMKDRMITELSGGEMQRASIAALIAQAPDIYLLDEPTNHLDIHYQARILSHFANLANNHKKTFIMATHDINIAATFCDYVFLFFPDGNIQHGKTNEMLTHRHLSHLYQHAIDAHQINHQLFWQPRWIAIE